jgi:predicted NBD/HSP70 family sugar kinase
MPLRIGVLATRHIWVGVVDGKGLAEPVRIYPEPGEAALPLAQLPAEEIVSRVREQILAAAEGRAMEAVGMGIPGIIRNGVVEDSPNLQQIKGFALESALSSALADHGMTVPVCILNDADAIAAGVAATRNHLERLIRAWYLGDGIGFGRYPRADVPWEAGHMVVSLDPKERFCGCGGEGHLEGIMGQRAMRLRFLDMEPEEVFAAARSGDARTADFLKLWHRALAAGCATSIHLEGPGRFYIAGPNAEFVDTALLSMYVHDMVKMSPLEGSTFETVETSHDLAIIGAAVNAA